MYFYREHIVNLCMHGANINLQTVEGQTPLFIAAQAGHPKMILQITGHGGDCGMVDYIGKIFLLLPTHVCFILMHCNFKPALQTFKVCQNQVQLWYG